MSESQFLGRVYSELRRRRELLRMQSAAQVEIESAEVTMHRPLLRKLVLVRRSFSSECPVWVYP